MSRDYWTKRAVELALQHKETDEQFVRYVNGAFNKANALISNEIIKKLEDIATDEDISMLDTVDLINSNKLEDVKLSLEQYINLATKDAVKYEEQLKKASNAYHLSYYQQVEEELNEILEALYNQTEEALKKFLDDTYANNYYRASYDIQKVQGYHYINKINKDKLEYLKSMPWLADGRDFSSRLWRQKDKLVDKLREEMTVSTLLQRGRQDTYKRMSKKEFLKKVSRDTSESMDQAKRRMKTLVYTESARMANEARSDGFKEHGIERYVITATLDIKTSNICRDMDKKEFYLHEKKIGLNYPPFHPNCRTTVRPPRRSVGTRAARDPITGKTYSVSGDLNYKEWYREYVEEQTGKNIDYMSNSFRPKYGKKQTIKIGNYNVPLIKIENSKFNIWTDAVADRRSMPVRLCEKNLEKISKDLPEGFQLPRINVVDFKSHGLNEKAIAGYDRRTNSMYINSAFKSEKAILKYINKTPGYFARTDALAPYLHELGHKYHYDVVEAIADKLGIAYNKAKDIFDGELRDYITNASSRDYKYLSRQLSAHAEKNFGNKDGINEVIAEFFTVRNGDSELINHIVSLVRRSLN